ncbi:lysosome-associated membrane glycoprotein 2-like isoform X1 [Dreissena polymorpha]|uniref:lysosome-associated membrane glycoprotein 2-like isoform X1 n=1 Tax=Dreissena polymorpha TaxID=45954 RepID=UPI0022653396|nr:lysosome-associated membrane glycoprotein 2-like isoform X1 [Dreissena polymorpha]XP_052215443.1 lysosome-associated membrane glycoprotein 2-like isoform X1 [Dreissena polymorpha]XP_052215444.1 lysosome-associated membrane glycoprotein 2-like isoform X1 [Dreissena polymorpha]
MIAKLVVASLLIGVCLGANKPTKIHYPEKAPSCIMVEFSSNNSLMFNSETMPNWDFSNISIVNEGSMCANGTGQAQVQIRFHADNATYTFFFKNNSGSVSINMQLEFIPNNVFKNNITDPVIIATSNAGTFQDTMSYACTSAMTYTGHYMDVKNNTYELTMRFMDVRMQAFNLKGEKFSEATHCAADEETTPMSTGTTPKSSDTTPKSSDTTPKSSDTTPKSSDTTPMSTGTTPMSTDTTPLTTQPLTTPEMTTPSPDPQSHPSFDGTVVNTDNSTCIRLKTEMLLILDYVINDTTNGTAKIGVGNPTVSGNCSDAGQRIRLDFLKYFSIEILFAKDDSNIYWDTVNVMGVYTEDLFPMASKMNKTFNFLNISGLSNQFKAKVDGSYLCNTDTSTTLIDGLTLETWNMQYTAFQKDATKFSEDDVSECSADSKTSSIVPIAVGAALAGLVVIVLIAYLIGRRRNRQGYDEM